MKAIADGLLRFRVQLADRTYLTRVSVEGFDGKIPAVEVEVRRSHREKDLEVLAIEIPMEFVEIEQPFRGMR